MREFRSYGSARGAAGNSRSYREHRRARETVRCSLISGQTTFVSNGPILLQNSFGRSAVPHVLLFEVRPSLYVATLLG